MFLLLTITFLLILASTLSVAAEDRLVGTCPNTDIVPPSNRGKSYSVADPTEAVGLCCTVVASSPEAAEWNQEAKVNACAAALFPSAAAGFEKVEATQPVEFTSPIGQGSPSQLIGKAIKAVLGVIGAIALAIFVYGGLMWMTSGGSPEKIKKAQTTLVWAVLGMLVIFASYAAVDFVLKSLGV